MRVIPWDILKWVSEEYFEMYSKTMKFFDPLALEHLFFKLNNEFGFDVEAENDAVNNKKSEQASNCGENPKLFKTLSSEKT